MLFEALAILSVAGVIIGVASPLVLGYVWLRSAKLRLFRFLVASLLAVTIAISAPALATDVAASVIVVGMDRNGDGMETESDAPFSQIETQAKNIHIQDGGRNLLILASPFLSAAYTVVVAIGFLVARRFGWSQVGRDDI